jgi:hypothetical protein
MAGIVEGTHGAYPNGGATAPANSRFAAGGLVGVSGPAEEGIPSSCGFVWAWARRAGLVEVRKETWKWQTQLMVSWTRKSLRWILLLSRH